MKVGAENKPMLVGAIVCAVLAVVFVARAAMEMGQATPPPPPPTNAATQGPQARRVRTTVQAPKSDSLDPTLRLDLLKASEDVEYKGSGRNIFTAEIEIPKPTQPVVKNTPPPQPQMVCPGDPACPKPPIPLNFYGFASKPGEPKKVFLSSKETGDVFVASEGEIVNRRYRVLHIGVNSVEIEDVLQNNRQTIPLTQG